MTLKVLPLSEWSIRFPSVLVGIVDVPGQPEHRGAVLEGAGHVAEIDDPFGIFRAQDLTVDQQIAFARRFGDAAPNVNQQACLPGYPEVLVVSNVHELSAAVSPWEERRGLVFIGGFQHPPNVDAVLWYAHEVVPHLRRALPGVKTYVIGSQVPPVVRALGADDLLILGHVADIEPYFTGCRVSIAPLRYGAGVKGKVNLAMSYGLPVVATSPSIEGMHLTEGEDVVVADDAAAFAAAVHRVYEDRLLWQRLSEGGRANVMRHFSPAVAREALRELLELPLDDDRAEQAHLKRA